MITRKVAPGIAAGCACVLKPAEQTPLSALALAELAERAGIPAGVINIVTGMDGPGIGQVMCADDRIRKMTFTGSTEVGRILMRQSADTLKKMSLELGGNAPLIVFDDADIDTAIAGTMASKYRNAGQTCVCANRIVQDGIYDEFAARLTEAAAAMKVGNGMEDGIEQGPIIDGQGLDKIERHVADARAKGAEVLTGGDRHELGGTFFQPTVLSGMTPQMEMFREETFGPVSGLFRFSTDDEAAMANDTEFGLAAYIFTNNTSRLFRVSEALEYGSIGEYRHLLLGSRPVRRGESPASAAKGRNTASTSFWRSSSSVWGCDRRPFHQTRKPGLVPGFSFGVVSRLCHSAFHGALTKLTGSSFIQKD